MHAFTAREHSACTSVFPVHRLWCSCGLFFFNDTATTEIYTLSLHDALPICRRSSVRSSSRSTPGAPTAHGPGRRSLDRKSTRLNSSHVRISYAVFCLKKKKHVKMPPQFAPAFAEFYTSVIGCIVSHMISICV